MSWQCALTTDIDRPMAQKEVNCKTIKDIRIEMDDIIMSPTKDTPKGFMQTAKAAVKKLGSSSPKKPQEADNQGH